MWLVPLLATFSSWVDDSGQSMMWSKSLKKWMCGERSPLFLPPSLCFSFEMFPSCIRRDQICDQHFQLHFLATKKHNTFDSKDFLSFFLIMSTVHFQIGRLLPNKIWELSIETRNWNLLSRITIKDQNTVTKIHPEMDFCDTNQSRGVPYNYRSTYMGTPYRETLPQE